MDNIDGDNISGDNTDNISDVNTGNISDGKYVMAVDVGSSNLKCRIYNFDAKIIGESSDKLVLQHPKPGWVELEPDCLWDTFITVCKNCLENANLKSSDIKSIGISTLRNTFILWDKNTKKHFHNFIFWNDVRCRKLCDEWNVSLKMKLIRFGSKILHFFSRSKRYLASSILKFKPEMVVIRLLWVLKNYPEIEEGIQLNNVLYGTVETWLIWKLTGGNVHATEPTSACCSGFFDPYIMQYSSICLTLLNLPKNILPEIIDNDGDFGFTSADIFETPIKIGGSIADQSAASFGECCFNVGDLKCTLGTGSFLNINTGNKAHCSMKGLYPIVGWKLTGKNVTYLAEAGASDTGIAIEWAKNIGIIDCVEDSSVLANSVSNSAGVYFVPAFSGIQAPINDDRAACSFIGISSSLTKAHLVRAIFEGICFRIKQIYEVMIRETKLRINFIRIDGGISNNDFITQLISDITGKEVERSGDREMSLLGAAYLAGLSCGLWKDLAEIVEIDVKRRNSSSSTDVQNHFVPQNSWNNNYSSVFMNWEKAIARCLLWYTENVV